MTNKHRHRACALAYSLAAYRSTVDFWYQLVWARSLAEGPGRVEPGLPNLGKLSGSGSCSGRRYFTPKTAKRCRAIFLSFLDVVLFAAGYLATVNASHSIKFSVVIYLGAIAPTRMPEQFTNAFWFPWMVPRFASRSCPWYGRWPTGYIRCRPLRFAMLAASLSKSLKYPLVVPLENVRTS